MDFKSFPKSKSGFNALLVFMDRLTKSTTSKKQAFNSKSPGNRWPNGDYMNQYIDQRLRPFINHFQDDWDEPMTMMDYAQASLPSDTTGFSPIEVELGYTPRASFDWSKPESR
jgi:hypothetical protein